MVSRLPPALESSLSLPPLSSRPHSWPEKATQRAGAPETARHPRQLGVASGTEPARCPAPALRSLLAEGGWGAWSLEAGRGSDWAGELDAPPRDRSQPRPRGRGSAEPLERSYSLPCGEGCGVVGAGAC